MANTNPNGLTALDGKDLSQLILALQYYKQHTEQQLSERSRQGWETSEQRARLEHLGQLEERLYEGLDYFQQRAAKK